MRFHRASVALLGAALWTTTSLAGCTPARRPAPTPGGPTPGALPGPAPTPAPATPAPAPAAPSAPDAAVEDRAQAVARAARQVPGVAQVWVVTTGRTAYVGIDADAGVARAPGANADLERRVGDAVRRAGVGIDRAYVTTRPELVRSIMEVERGVRAGRPVSQFARQLARLAAEITPTASP